MTYCSLVHPIFVVLLVNFLMAVFAKLFFFTLCIDGEMKGGVPGLSV